MLAAMQVQVSVNGMTAACASAAGGCPYAAEAEATPVITRVQETQANAGLHRSLAIFGSHFGPDSKVTVAWAPAAWCPASQCHSPRQA